MELLPLLYDLRGGVEEGFDFAGKLTDPVYTHFAASRQRQFSTSCSLNQSATVAGMMAALRQHNPKDQDKVFTHGSVRSVCMHAGGLVGDHTTGSLVATLRQDKPATLWCTGASTPCIAAFKPVFLSAPGCGPVFENEAYAKQYWLKREQLHRGILAGLADASGLRARISALEADWIAQEEKLFANGSPDKAALQEFSKKAAAEDQALIEEFIPQQEIKMPEGSRFGRYWAKKNAVLGQE
jgi:hypothetical protein